MKNEGSHHPQTTPSGQNKCKRVFCGTERGKDACAQWVCTAVLRGVRTRILSGTRVLSGFERAEWPASVSLRAMPVLKFSLDVFRLHRMAPSMRSLHMQLQHGLTPHFIMPTELLHNSGHPLPNPMGLARRASGDACDRDGGPFFRRERR